MKHPRYLLRNILSPGDLYHAARYIRQEGHVSEVHAHDFAEVFWMEHGSGLHLVNGEQQRLGAGDLLLIRARDVHGFHVPHRAVRGVSRGVAFCAVNIAFPLALLNEFRKRQKLTKDNAWPWTGGNLPTCIPIGAEGIRRLDWFAGELIRRPQSRLKLEAFLATVLLMASCPEDAQRRLDCPEWLNSALTAFNRPAKLSGGVQELSNLSGRSIEHVNRTVRKFMGITSTDLVNNLRLEFCARELLVSSRPILEIALDAGIQNLSHFYRMFQAKYHKTPRRFRLDQDKSLL
jgi:AraC-like DNA-binding protein